MVNKIGVIGASLWSGRLARILEEHTPLKCPLICELSIKDFWRIPLVFSVRNILRVGFRPGVFRARGILIDLVSLLFVLLGGKLTFYWTGSDVQRTSGLLEAKSLCDKLWGVPISRLLLNRAQHCCAAPWLVDELSLLEVDAVCLPFPSPTSSFEEFSTEDLQWPERFTVLSYIPDHNYANYCGNVLLKLAKAMPDVDFQIMGGHGGWCLERPPNLIFLGWVDPIKAYRESVVVIRAVKHDALGGTVREALLCGRYVIYTYPHYHTVSLSRELGEAELAASLDAILAEFRNQFVKGELEVNLSGRQWVMDNLTEQNLARDFYHWLSSRN